MIKITFTYRHRKEIAIALIILIIIITGIILLVMNFPKKEKTETLTSVITKKDEQKKQKQEEEIEYKVDIKGEVNSPGIYSLEKSSRVIDVIEKAGGLTENANTSVINLSKKIEDEMVIIIYSNYEIKNFEKTKEKEEYLQKKCLQATENALQNDACITNSNEQKTTTTPQTGKISLNSATQEQLMTLPGIGEAKAKEIIKYREKKPFTKVEELKEISGIGESVFAKVKDLITI